MKLSRRHTDATKHLTRQLNRQDRKTVRTQLRRDPDAVLHLQPRGRAIWLSY